MKAFSTLLDRLSHEPRRTEKLRHIVRYLREAPDPDRGHALAALCGALDIPAVKPAMLRALVSERVDPVLFGLSYDFVGDLSETIALIWPAQVTGKDAPLHLAEVISTLLSASRREGPALIARWLDELDETGRWALLKLITGALRVGVSALLARQALAEFSGHPVEEIEEVWHGVEPPYTDLFAWLEGRGPRPNPSAALTFRSPMLAHPIEDQDFETLAPSEFHAEWKWDGIRIQAATRSNGLARDVRLFSRSGDDITTAFPDLIEALPEDAVIDGELVVARDTVVATFSDLQQRLNRKSVSAAMLRDSPVALMAYDLLQIGGEDLRPHSLPARRARLKALVEAKAHPRLMLSPAIPFATWEELAEKRAQSAENPAIEGVMLKRLNSPYLAGRPKGFWYKWKRDPMIADCVMMYAQRGHGKRSSFYSDFTFGVWEGEKLVPVGKAYFGFTDEELKGLDRFVRQNTINRFGPVREVAHAPDSGLVLEIAFEGLQESTRHRSGLAMRFPRIHRIRNDKKPAEADRIETLRSLLRKA
ncbi:MAG: cisplatin damage response ATP-dependent DNA ligase [Methylobacterium sp.]|nr:cisplatin damage response ATP-dependent DNA ligase [Methylobacterium sp.]